MRLNDFTGAIIGSALAVHRHLGPGLLETAYRKCLAYELRERGCEVIEELPVPLIYGTVQLDCAFRADLLVNRLVVVEVKAKISLHPIDEAQTLSHLKLLKMRVGLLINFHEVRLKDGIRRIINGY